jgi:serine/threonine-protein kinase
MVMTADIGQPGQIIDGKYRITRLLGTGGMGAVYEGENIRIRRKVAIKMLHASVSSQPEVVARFEREAQAAALVGSEHICEVLDLGELPDHTRYMVMEYLDGETLSSLIKRTGRLTYPQSIPILVQILDALGAAHAAGIIHRDLKPDNVFILPQRGGIQNFVKILDFGVSKFSQMGGEAMNVTRAGAVVGTPYYMSPEQAKGSSAIDQRTDIYAIGVLLYQATTGQVPYQAETFNELLFKIVLEVAPPPQTYVPDLDPEFAAIIQRAMAREPEQRFQSCAQFRDALLAFQQARANPLPAYAMPRMHGHDPAPARTEVLDTSRLPIPQAPPAAHRSGAQWPAAFPPPVAPDGTMPMQPGLPMAANTGSGGAMSPVAAGQSGPNWAVASNPGAAPAPPTANTANAWGNASSPSANMPAPAPAKSKAPMVIAVIGLAALLGVGGAIAAFTVFGKKAAPAQAATNAPSASAAPSATASAAPTTSASAAPSAEPSAAPSAEPAAVASTTPAAPTTAKPALTGKLPPAAGATSAKPAASGTGKAGKAGKSKSTGNDLGY